MVDLISAGVIGKSIWWVCDHASGGAITSFQQSALERMRFSTQARNNHNLQQALRDSFSVAIKSLRAPAGPDEQAHWDQIGEQGKERLDEFHGGFVASLLDAILFDEPGSETWRELWEPVRSRLDVKETRSFFEASRLVLEHRLQESFANVLTTDKHRPALVVYQQAMLFEILSELRANANQVSQNTIEVLDAIRLHGDLLDQSTALVLEVMASVDRAMTESVAENAKQLGEIAHGLDELRQSVDGDFVGPDGTIWTNIFASDCRIVKERLLEQPPVGREGELDELSARLEDHAFQVVAGVSGAGKSAFLARWIHEHESSSQMDICYHFFSRESDTDRLETGMACILEQLLKVHGIKGRVPEVREKIRPALRLLLEMRHARRLVIVLDGLDEAQDQFRSRQFPVGSDWFPQVLGDNVNVVLGSRYGAGIDDADDLARQLGIKSLKEMLMLDLEEPSIALLLEERFRDLARSVKLQTGGLAIYVSKVIKAVNEQSDQQAAEQQVHNLPREFGAYVERSLGLAIGNLERWRDPIGFMAAATSPLSIDELVRLCERSRSPILHIDFKPLNWDIARWITVGRDGLCSFQHDSVRQVVEEFYAAGIQHYRVHLLEDCRHWDTHAGQYSLRNYPRDLLRSLGSGQFYEELIGLGRNDVYRERQRSRFPVEPELSLLTTQIAMQAAITHGDPLNTIRLVFEHLRVIERGRRESPLEAFRAGDLEWSLWLARLRSISERAAYLLLIAWEAERGKSIDLWIRIKQELALLPQFKPDELFCAALALVLVHADAEVRYAASETFFHQLDVDQLVDIALMQMNLDHSAGASITLEKALKEARSIDNERSRPFVLARIAQARADNGDFGGAREVADLIGLEWMKETVRAEIDKSEMNALDSPEVQDTADAGDMGDEAVSLVENALAQARDSDFDGASFTLGKALEEANRRDDTEPEYVVLAEIAQAMAGNNDFDDALELAGFIDDHKPQQKQVLAKIAEARGNDDDIDRAMNVVSQIGDGREGASVTIIIPEIQERPDSFQGALEAASRIDDEWERMAAMAGIAEKQIAEGHLRDAYKTVEFVNVDSIRFHVYPLLARSLFAEEMEEAVPVISYCAHHAKSVRALVVHFAEDYPQHAKEFARMVMEFTSIEPTTP